jgi:phospholipase C
MMRRPLSSIRWFPLFLLVGSSALSACAGRATIPSRSAAPYSVGSETAPVRGSNGKIRHVVVIVQENRSFDNLFQGYPGANTVSVGKNSQGKTITLQPIGLEAPYGLSHTSSSFFAACDGLGSIPGTNCKMDGFDKEVPYGPKIPPNPEYGYVPHNETALYFQMAGQYVLADEMFTSHIDASFASHQYIIAGQANHTVDIPSTLWGCGGGPSDTVSTLNADRSYGPAVWPCFDSPTIASELDAKGMTWRYYASDSMQPEYVWSAFQAISSVYNGPEWTNNVITPPAQVLTDIENGALANVTWVTPTCANSDHATCLSNQGPDWVASVVDAVGQSKFWTTSTIFVMWDEWGGWYDHVAPPYVDYDGLGLRVPLLIISPYAKQGVVSHVQYEHGSILKYIEDTFGLVRLAGSDTRANSPVPDAIDYSQKARTFTPFASRRHARSFVAEPPDRRPVDDN